jgi:hypothetical protein
LLHVRDRDAALIRKLTAFLRAQEWAGVLFTAGRPNLSGGASEQAPIEGIEPGTFSLELVHLAHPERGPDIVVTFPWSSASNAFGVTGTDMTNVGGATGPIARSEGNHGSMSPWTVHNTFIAWGPDFKRGTTVRTPVSNMDVTPTLVTLIGLGGDPALPRFDGRAILEALADGPDPEQIPLSTTTYFAATPDDAYRAAIVVSEVGGERYLDKSWRVK